MKIAEWINLEEKADFLQSKARNIFFKLSTEDELNLSRMIENRLNITKDLIELNPEKEDEEANELKKEVEAFEKVVEALGADPIDLEEISKQLQSIYVIFPDEEVVKVFVKG